MIKIFRHINQHLTIEATFLVLFLICYIRSLPSFFVSRPTYVHQLRSFQQLDQRLDNCFIDKTNNNSSIVSDKNTHCPVDHDRLQFFNDDEITLNPSLVYNHIKFGGHYVVNGCKSRQKVAIIIPYRNRKTHLDQFSLYIHRFLPDQLVDYSLYVVEQSKLKKFNRAKLFNIGVREVLKRDPTICCFIFHDVDLIPLDQRNLYMCTDLPRHMSVGVSSLRYRLPYETIFGGVVAISKKQFEHIGGFSNDYFGWGGEDDDMFRRIIASGLDIQRTPQEYGLYNALFHPHGPPNPDR